jgi:hypothetical protein
MSRLDFLEFVLLAVPIGAALFGLLLLLLLAFVL